MKDCFITFRSITPAQRGENLLRRNGVFCSIQRTPKWMQEQGCSYSLWLHSVDGLRAGSLLQANGIAYRKIYLHENGKLEELHL